MIEIKNLKCQSKHLQMYTLSIMLLLNMFLSEDTKIKKLKMKSVVSGIYLIFFSIFLYFLVKKY